MHRTRPRKVILDCDIGWMNDDCTATIFALKSPELQVLGITPVAGNFDLNWETACALRLVEILGRENVPVCPGFDRPLIHERDDYEDQVWGEWATFKPVDSIPPGLPTIEPDPRHACDFIAQSILGNPGEVSILAMGPLTNVAVAIRKYPQVVPLLDELIVMGGAVATLPRGHGNITPVAEFNFWVDPEAARIVLRAGVPIVLCPLNVCRRTRFERQYFDRLTSVDSAHPEVAGLFRDYLQPHFDHPEVDKESPRLFYGLYDQILVVYALRPAWLATVPMNVDVNVTPGPEYGASYGYTNAPYQSGLDQWPLDDGSQVAEVAYDVELEAFVELYVNTLTE